MSVFEYVSDPDLQVKVVEFSLKLSVTRISCFFSFYMTREITFFIDEIDPLIESAFIIIFI